MKLKNIHLDESFLVFVKKEAERQKVKEAVIIRNVIALGLPKYKKSKGLPS